ncbi:MAG: short-chain dehydrogenase/reductase SDR [Candidatus Marinimicrobia bacterium]|nr:short-chain dehydrogenase/reductase SDR [Candidatus Neomarinimicrobiota bacterium]
MAHKSVEAPYSGFGRRSTAEDVTAGLDLRGKTILLTGCTSGIGLETMKTLAKCGGHVIGVGRTQKKADMAWRSVSDSNMEGYVTPIGCELEDFGAVVDLAEKVRAMNMPIDTLICNAGILGRPKLEIIKGIEKQFAVNHLSHFILINQLLDQVKLSPQGRVIIVASDAHKNTPMGGIDFSNLSGGNGYSALKFYGQSKLANILTARKLAQHLSGTEATANALHPGFVRTNIFHNLPTFLNGPLKLLARPFMKSLSVGAATTCYLATSPKLVQISGQYFSNCNMANPSALGRNDALAQRLWETSENLVSDYLR